MILLLLLCVSKNMVFNISTLWANKKNMLS